MYRIVPPRPWTFVCCTSTMLSPRPTFCAWMQKDWTAVLDGGFPWRRILEESRHTTHPCRPTLLKFHAHLLVLVMCVYVCVKMVSVSEYAPMFSRLFLLLSCRLSPSSTHTHTHTHTHQIHTHTHTLLALLPPPSPRTIGGGSSPRASTCFLKQTFVSEESVHAVLQIWSLAGVSAISPVFLSCFGKRGNTWANFVSSKHAIRYNSF